MAEPRPTIRPISRRARALLPTVLLAGSVLTWLGLRPLTAPLPPPPGLPAQVHDQGYLGSDGCRMCHPAEYQSWQRTYHRTMTRTAQDLLAGTEEKPLLPVDLRDQDLNYQLSTDSEGRLWAQGPDLHRFAEALYQERRRRGAYAPDIQSAQARRKRVLEGIPEARREIVLVTGSHHYLAFWVSGGPEKELRQLPFVYFLNQPGWAPREEVFLQPPEALPHIARWNANCIQCHAVAGRPHESERANSAGQGIEVTYRSAVAEFGISCEACHGPGRGHAENFRNPWRRWRAQVGSSRSQATSGIVNPARLSAAQEGAICRQCHAYFVPQDPDAWWETGYVGRFTPGDTLDESRQLLLPREDELRRAKISQSVESIFWGDGTIRVGGREASGLLSSPCYQNGSGDHQLRCSHCHSLHEGSRDDQLKPALKESADVPCLSCHKATAEHSGHADGSVGASCVNCHMPKTTYALLKSIRSHRITSPSHRLTDPPSACVLCHLERSEQWHHEQLTRLFPQVEGWQGLRPVRSDALPSPSESVAIPYGVKRALSADAAERAVFAAHLATPETQLASGSAWPRAVLEQLTHDPYHAVRRIAERSLVDIKQLAPAHHSDLGLPVPPAVLAELHARRDNTPVIISE